MVPGEADRNVLFGLMAFEMGLIDRAQLLAAGHAWIADKSRPMGEILLEQGALERPARERVELMVDLYADHPSGDATTTLRDSASLATACQTLHELSDGDVEATLAFVSGSEAWTGETTGSWQGSTSGATLPPTTSAGRFRMLRRHAQGGLGEVFVARDEEVRREVALKLIRAERAGDEQSRARFLLEAEITGSLEHPGIVPIYGVGCWDDGRPFYAMRLIRGGSLKDAIVAFHTDAETQADPGRRQLELRKLLDRFLDVCDAIDFAHSRGVVHRDLKPSNVMLGAYGETLVVDWGLAKALGKSEEERAGDAELLRPESGSDVRETVMGTRIGTLAFMPPEQAGGRINEIGTHSDVYSLGATLYVLLTGRLPITGPDVATQLRRIEEGDVLPPRRVQPWIDGALEAICLKAMAPRPTDRYASPRALAEELERWKADEPVAAYPDPPAKRLVRWCKKHRTAAIATAAALAVGLVATSYLVYEARLRAEQRLVAALSRVEALTTAEARALPLILEQLAPERDLVRNRLEALARQGGASGRSRLAAALALLPIDRGQRTYLLGRAMEPSTTPEELLVIREALARHCDRVTLARDALGRLPARPGPLSDEHLRAAGLLALVAPEDPSWSGLAAPVVQRIVHENPLWIAPWRDVFRPVDRHLVGPLRGLFADRSQPEARERAFTLLFDLATRLENRNRPEDLAALLADADPDRCRKILALLDEPGDRARAIGVLVPGLKPIARADPDGAARQGRIAAALSLMGETGPVWPLFAFGEDPSVRTEIVHQLARYGVEAEVVAERVKRETDVGARRALILCLGGFLPKQLSSGTRGELATLFQQWYREDPDPGIHGAVDWILRRCWGFAEHLQAADRSLASPRLPADRRWFVNPERQTYVVLDGPITFSMGTTRQVDPDSEPQEVPHRHRIGHSYAIATREVTVAEYNRFLASRPTGVRDNRSDEEFKTVFPADDCAIGLVTWFEAAAYCNWLSTRDGIAEDQFAYPREIGPNMNLPSDHLEKLGYRLPTSAEWEYACRAGTTSARPFGSSPEWVGEYTWFAANFRKRMHGAAEKKPNDLGLFDMLGNAYEWCLEAEGWSYPVRELVPGVVLEDTVVAPKIPEDVNRLIRGGAFTTPPYELRSSNFRMFGPNLRLHALGFRPVRTLPARRR